MSQKNHYSLVRQERRIKLLAEVADLAAHDRRMAEGCLVCYSAVPGRCCPDCYVCITCQPKCDECAANHPPSQNP